MRAGWLALAAAVLLTGCDARAGVASIGSQDLPSPVSYRVTGTVSVGNYANGVAVDPGTHTVYVEGEYVLLVIDGLTQTVTATVPLREKQEGHPIHRNDLAGQVALDTDTHTVYVGDVWRRGVTVIDGSTHTVTATVPLGGSPDNIAVDSGSHTIYVTREDVNNVTHKVGRAMSVIDGTTRTVTADIPTALWGSMAVDPDTHTVFAATGPNSSDNAVSVIGGTTGTVITTIPISYSAYGVAVDPESHIVYVTGLVPHHPYGAVSIIESVPG